MKRPLFPFLIVVFLSIPHPAFAASACEQRLHASGGADRQSREAALNREVEQFRTLAERALSLRAETIRVGRGIREKLEQDRPLSGDDIALISTGITEHLALRKELLARAEAYECWLDASPEKLARQGITAEARLTGVMLSLSSAMLLYDNYLLAISLFEGDGKLRRILNERDPGYRVKRAALAKITMSYDSAGTRARVRRAIRFYERETGRADAAPPRDRQEEYLRLLIAQSPSYTMLRKWSPLYLVGRKIGFWAGVTSDTLTGMEREGVSLLSMVFGNAVGLVETRRGKLYRNEQVLADIGASLKAGDILLEKTPFRLTDKLIPGYWGHAAVWIGTEEELRELGIWDNPLVVNHHGEIRQGRLVVEALRSGVEMNSLRHFLNIDSIGVLRRPGQSREARAATIIQALRQVGKPYDFTFDVESKERVYCSKLVYLSYGDMEWPTRRTLGRATFTPDDVAALAADGGSLQLVAFYHDGERVSQAPLTRMAELMGTGTEQRAAP